MLIMTQLVDQARSPDVWNLYNVNIPTFTETREWNQKLRDIYWFRPLSIQTVVCENIVGVLTRGIASVMFTELPIQYEPREHALRVHIPV